MQSGSKVRVRTIEAQITIFNLINTKNIFLINSLCIDNMNQNAGVTDFQLKLQEAEVCHSMGLLNEALDLYRQAFTTSTDQDKKDQEIIEHKISQVQKRLQTGKGLVTR